MVVVLVEVALLLQVVVAEAVAQVGLEQEQDSLLLLELHTPLLLVQVDLAAVTRLQAAQVEILYSALSHLLAAEAALVVGLVEKLAVTAAPVAAETLEVALEDLETPRQLARPKETTGAQEVAVAVELVVALAQLELQLLEITVVTVVTVRHLLFLVLP